MAFSVTCRQTCIRDNHVCDSVQEVKDERDEATRALENEAKKVADDLDLELDKTAKLEWFKSNNVSLRCLRITPKEVCVPLFVATGWTL